MSNSTYIPSRSQQLLDIKLFWSGTVVIRPAADPYNEYTRVNLARKKIPFVKNLVPYDAKLPMIDKLQLEPIKTEPWMFWVGPSDTFYGEYGALDLKIFEGIKEIICVDSSPSGNHFPLDCAGYKIAKDEYSFIGAICKQLTYTKMEREGIDFNLSWLRSRKLS